MRDWIYRHHRKCRGGKCRTGVIGTILQGVENAGPSSYARCCSGSQKIIRPLLEKKPAEMLHVCKQRCKYVRQSNWDCTWQLSLIQTQHHGDRSATKRTATSFRCHPCRTRRTETLMDARDQCMVCIALLNHADFTEVGRLYGCWRCTITVTAGGWNVVGVVVVRLVHHVARNTRPQTVAHGTQKREQIPVFFHVPALFLVRR